MAGSLKDRLREDLNVARRERDKARTLLLTTTLSEVRNREIELGREATDEDVQQVVQRAVKRPREAAEQMREGHREDLTVRPCRGRRSCTERTHRPPPIRTGIIA